MQLDDDGTVVSKMGIWPIGEFWHLLHFSSISSVRWVRAVEETHWQSDSIEGAPAAIEHGWRWIGLLRGECV